jgi:diguanylate cyclase (GGDEF)-like protein/PAS domain S-box-containing protein
MMDSMLPLPANEIERLGTLHDLRILDTSPEDHFDAVCNTAAAMFGVPIALVSLIDRDRQWFKAKCGLSVEGTPRDLAFCSHAIMADDVLVVEDAYLDPRFSGNPLVTGAPGIRFYAGAPLILGSGAALGTLCVIDTKPRPFDEAQRLRLRDLARIVVAHIELHRGRLALAEALDERSRSEARALDGEARHRALADTLPQMVWVKSSADGRATYMNDRFRSYYGDIGPGRDERVGRNHPDDAARMEEAWRAAVRHERTYAVEGRLRRRDGIHRWHKLVMIPVRRDGVVAEWLGTALDIEDIVTAREALERTTDLLRLAQEAAGAGVWQWDIDENVVSHSPESARLHGLPHDAGSTAWVEVSVAEWRANVHPDDMRVLHEARVAAIQEGTTYKVEFRVRRTDGVDGWRCLNGFGRVIRCEATGRATRVVGLNLDVTDQRATQDALVGSESRLRVSEERLALALESGNDGLWDWDVPTGNVWFSDRWQAMLGYGPGEISPDVESWQSLTHPDDRQQAMALLTEHFDGLTPSYACEQRMRRKSGEYLWILARGRVVSRDGHGKPLRLVGTYIDITDRKEAERRIAYLARHDVLTGLPNRTVFHEHLEQRLADVRVGRGQAALLCLDLDRFKTINDTLGHPAGDKLLCRIADRLKDVVADEHSVVRLGGDEFAIIVPHVEHVHEVSLLAQRVIDAVGEPLDLDGHLASVGISIGIAIAPENSDTTDTLFKNADLALYRAKSAAGNTYRFYEPDMDAAVAARMRMEVDMREAIVCGGFALHYQPVMDIASGRIAGFEALMRWPHATKGMIVPGEFIPLAEETGLVVPLGDWALREACREAASWPGNLKVAVNVSAVQFQRPGLEQSVMSALSDSGLAPHRLELEITESVLVQDAEAVIACLHRLRDLGIRIALDDFGTGYSSLSYLRRFPFDKLKIDRSFVKDIGNQGTSAIVRAIVSLGVGLGMTVTAEGIETKDQLGAVRAMNCNEGQGYIFSRPMPARDAARFIGMDAVKRAA